MRLIGPVRRNGRYGYITTHGDFAIDPVFEELGSLSEGLVSYCSADKIGFLNSDGSTRIPARHDKKQYYPLPCFKNAMALVPSKESDGYINLDGSWHIKPEWHIGWNFLDDKALVLSDDGYFVIDVRGNPITKLDIYEVAAWPDWVKDWRCFRCLMDNQTADFAHACLNWKGEIVFPPAHAELTEFHEGVAGFRDGKQTVSERWGLVNFSGAIIKEPQYFALGEFSEGLAAAARNMTPRGKTKRRGYIDAKGDWQIEPAFNCARPFSDGLACVSKNKPVNQYGFINRTGELVIPLIYSSPANFVDGYAVVEIGDEVHVIDRQGVAIYRGPR